MKVEFSKLSCTTRASALKWALYAPKLVNAFIIALKRLYVAKMAFWGVCLDFPVKPYPIEKNMWSGRRGGVGRPTHHIQRWILGTVGYYMHRFLYISVKNLQTLQQKTLFFEIFSRFQRWWCMFLTPDLDPRKIWRLVGFVVGQKLISDKVRTWKQILANNRIVLFTLNERCSTKLNITKNHIGRYAYLPYFRAMSFPNSRHTLHGHVNHAFSVVDAPNLGKQGFVGIPGND